MILSHKIGSISTMVETFAQKTFNKSLYITGSAKYEAGKYVGGVNGYEKCKEMERFLGYNFGISSTEKFLASSYSS